MAFAEYKDNDEFINLIQKAENYRTLNRDTHPETGGGSLYKWCVDNLKIDLTDESKTSILPNVEKYCTKPSKTFEERATKANKRLVTDWDNRFLLISSSGTDSQNARSLKRNITDYDPNVKEAISSKEILQNWCTRNIKKEISFRLFDYRDNKFWNLIVSRCYE